jgi:hypothetical protein
MDAPEARSSASSSPEFEFCPLYPNPEAWGRVDTHGMAAVAGGRRFHGGWWGRADARRMRPWRAAVVSRWLVGARGRAADAAVACGRRFRGG